MVLIFTNKSDYTSKLISHWLVHFGIKVKVFYLWEDYIDITHIELPEKNIYFKSTDNHTFSLKEIDGVIFRFGAARISDFVNIPTDRKTFQNEVQYFLSGYTIAKAELLNKVLNELHAVGANDMGRYNKILALEYADAVGLNIPPTLTTTEKTDVIAFKNKHENIIVKSLDINFDFFDSDNKARYHQYTCEVKENDILLFPDSFNLTLFQKRIFKKFEIRTFYLDGKIFSSAILSQKNQRTAIDYRRYDLIQDNRKVPFKLPLEIENKIIEFMKMANLNTGSIDIIYGEDNNYYFLEVNPIGQFMKHSEVCNDKLDKQIAKYLLNHEK